MSQLAPKRISPKWSDKVFSAKAVADRGVVRRAIVDIGRAAFELRSVSPDRIQLA
jgi:hypothetical protein